MFNFTPALLHRLLSVNEVSNYRTLQKKKKKNKKNPQKQAYV